MKTLSKLLIATLGLFSLVSCLNTTSRSKDSASAAKSAEQLEQQTPRFTPPHIPSQITSPEGQLGYLVEHFWDSYNLSDSLLLADKDVTDQAFALYLTLLVKADDQSRSRSIEKLLSRSLEAPTAAFERFTTLFENYLYNPNSPYLNEELYIPVLSYIVANDSIDDILKLRPQMQLEMAMKNRVGSVALDFEYTLSNGRRGAMHSIDAPYTILFFNNPDCHDCARVKEYFDNSIHLQELWQQGAVKVLSIYPDPDIDLWRQNAYPEIMINGYDASQRITTDRLYDLKAIPTLYLLDEGKRVLLKDAPVEGIEAYLRDR